MESEMYLGLQRTCLKHCTDTILKGEMDKIEQLCLKRCSNKYVEAMDFAQKQFKIHELKTEEFGKNQKMQQELLAQQKNAQKKLFSKLGFE